MNLNPQQHAAVVHGAGPLLILAGAGSGKTRVITHRIAHLISGHSVDPRSIVAMTFTNKAAGEMRQRVEALLAQEISGAYVGTFHAFGLRMMRQHAVDAGYPASFVVYDSADQLALVKQALHEERADEKAFPSRQVLTTISRFKNALIDPDEAASQARFPNEKLYANCYRFYDEALRRSGAMDFDDLLVQPIRLLRRRPDLAARYAQRIEWLLVDEYQDTNPLQYALIRLLAAQHPNLCCVGDEDQSIYAFRGADIRNILDFERDFPNATIIKLEQNYRSTGNILAAASTVIRNNTNRHDKTLWTENPTGGPLVVRICQDDRSEADFVVDEMQRRTRELELALDDVAVLYRTNASSRLLEDRLTARNIPYRVIGSVRFYERKEIKDLVAWLRMLVNPDSDQDFLRAASTPPRGIGDTTIAELAKRASEQRGSLYRAASLLLAARSDAAARTVKVLSNFVEIVAKLTEMASQGAAAEALQLVLDEIDYIGYLEKAFPQDHVDRRENLDALVNAAKEYDESSAATGGLAGFLDRVSLRSDTDDTQGRAGPTLMTVHSAKGLEFPLVFLIGLNENLFPHAMAQTAADREEERRLMYVALTRAQQQVVLTAARFRHHYGKATFAEPSPFLDEIPAELKQETREGGSEIGERRPLGSGIVPHGFRPRFGAQPAAPTVAAGLRTATAIKPSERTIEYEPDLADDETPAFRIGLRVVHPSFGPGVVLAVRGRGDKLTLEISFTRGGRKTILPKYAHLTPG